MLARTSENRAAEIGPGKFSWWKDWRGECVAIVASGPSTKKEIVESLKNRIHVIAIKKNIDLCPFADVVYGCDGPWWKNVRGLPEYRGLKLTYDAGAAGMFADLHKIEIDKKRHEILTDEPGTIGSGLNSGFQAINLAVQFGATAILLIGYDCDDRSGVHWYGRNNWPGANNPDRSSFPGWNRNFTAASLDLKTRGIDVVNASPNSAINCFHKASVEDAFRQWGL